MTQARTLLELARHQGALRSRDLARHGVHRETLRRLVRQGQLVRSARGVYTPVDFDLSAHHSLAEAAQRLPRATVCLLSALSFHELTTQLPHQVWVALDRRQPWSPQEPLLPLTVTYMSGRAFSEGVEVHDIEGVSVPIFNVPKTIVDCFKFRSKVGLDVALEALRQGWHERRFQLAELRYYAGICRMQQVMRPYLEFLS